MPESPPEPNVIISAQAHQHPAVRKLARACISLAMLQQAGSLTASTAEPSPGAPHQPAPPTQERHDD